MTDERFVHWFRVCLLTAGVGWRVCLAFPAVALGSTLFVLAAGCAPYALLAALANWVRRRRLLAALGTAVLAVDVAAALQAMGSTSSTAAVAIVLAPLLLTGLVLVFAALLGAVRVLARWG